MIKQIKKTYFDTKQIFLDAHTSYKKKKLGYPLTLVPSTNKIKGRALYSYIIDPFYFFKNDKRFNGHTNRWESFIIPYALKDLGYIVDIIHFLDTKFVPTEKYDFVFDMYQNLSNWHPNLSKSTKRILHATGSYNPYGNQAEKNRIVNLQKRKPGAIYSPKRQVEKISEYIHSLEIADHIILMGNETTLSTYPEKFHNKTSLIHATASPLKHIKKQQEFVPDKKEFLWFFGCGAIHKGLDLLVEIFSKHPELKLNIIGSIDGEREKEFFKIYEKEFRECKNIKYHGYLQPSSKKFFNVIKNVFCFIAPSASEGMSPACITCMQAGLFPIISKNCGITLPKNIGLYLKDCSIEEIEKSILRVYNMKKTELENQIKISQQYALIEFSRENFIKNMKAIFEKIL
jgi:glycosyltransferase involved in cell wall biosynthesis